MAPPPKATNDYSLLQEKTICTPPRMYLDVVHPELYIYGHPEGRQRQESHRIDSLRCSKILNTYGERRDLSQLSRDNSHDFRLTQKTSSLLWSVLL